MTKRTANNRSSRIQIGRKRPYDFPEIGTTFPDNKLGLSLEPLNRHFYLPEVAQKTVGNRAEELKQSGSLDQLPLSKLVGQTRRPINQKSELIRNQHRPPWRWRPSQAAAESERRDNMADRYEYMFTTLPSATATDFFNLISSAHSPIKLTRPSVQKRKFSYAGPSQVSINSVKLNKGQNNDHRNQTTNETMTTTTTSTVSPITTGTPATNTSSLSQNASLAGRVMSPEILVSDGDSGNQNRRKGSLLVRGPSNGNRPNSDSRFDGLDSNVSLYEPSESRHIVNLKLNTSNSNYYSSRRPILIVSRKPNVTTREPTILVIPEKITVQEEEPPTTPFTLVTTTGAPQFVRLISKQKHKYDDNITSPTLTVVDNDAIRLPPNAISVHNNKLIVAIRPGRPLRRHPPTTQFPVYNIVAGITPPYASNPTTIQITRPPSSNGSVYGLLKPTGADTTTTLAPSTFGAQNIKFPAPEPTSLQPDHAEPPDKLNISVPDSANMVGPNKVPDKIVMETEEQYNRPPDAVVISDSTIISRPYGSNTVTNQDGIMKLSTTRRPSRFTTTKRINIVSANTTVVTTNPDQLHEVLSGVIATHQQDHIHHVNQNRPSKSSLLATLANFFNAGVTTSAIAILTLLKTIFVAILVMFLPPLALTTAIMQAVSMG